MEKLNKFFAHKIFKVFKWAFLIFIVFSIFMLTIRTIHSFKVDKINAVVKKIHSTKLTMDDVMGKNLPPNPGALTNKTVEGIDVNNNGIRDDVELAIFKKYPNSAKTRAVLLQYALAMQMEFTQSIVDTKTVTEVITELSRADTCLADTLVPRKTPESSRADADMKKINHFIEFIKNKQFNTKVRKEVEEKNLKYLRSYGNSTNQICDINISKLPN